MESMRRRRLYRLLSGRQPKTDNIREVRSGRQPKKISPNHDYTNPIATANIGGSRNRQDQTTGSRKAAGGLGGSEPTARRGRDENAQ